MIHLTELLAISLPSYPVDKNRVYSDGLCNDVEVETTFVQELPDLMMTLARFSRSVFPFATTSDLMKFNTMLLDQHLIGSLFHKKDLGSEIDLNKMKLALESVPFVLTSTPAFEFLLADYLTTRVIRPEFARMVEGIVYEDFAVSIALPFYSVYESAFETILHDVEDMDDPILRIYRDPKVPLFYGEWVDPVELGNHVVQNYTLEYLKELVARTLYGRVPIVMGASASTFMPKLIEDRFHQIKNKDWVGFLEGDLGLKYAAFENGYRIGGSRFLKKLSKLTIHRLIEMKLDLRISPCSGVSPI